MPSGYRDLKGNGMLARLRRRHVDRQFGFALDPLQFAFVAQQFHRANVDGLGTPGREGFDVHPALRPAHHECVQSLALRGEAYILRRQILPAVLVESELTLTWRRGRDAWPFPVNRPRPG